MTTEEHCYYVSSKGLMRICDVYELSPDQAIQKINESKSKSGHIITVYFNINYLREFAARLHLLNKKVKLVTGGDDHTVPIEVFSEPEFHAFIQHKNLHHYFAQNCVLVHPKITNIPIGLDYHTMSGNSHWWGAARPQTVQESELIAIRNSAAPLRYRKRMCYSNFHFVDYHSKFGYKRADVIAAVPSDLVFYEPSKIERTRTWKNQAEYAFVLSPFGNGLDCHRTWESLVLGCIPIVRASPLDVLYEGLPVLVVNDWRDVTKTLLEQTIERYKVSAFDYNRLTLAYWKSVICSA